MKNDLSNSNKEENGCYHKPPSWTFSSLLLTEEVLGIFASTEQVVLWLTQNLNHALHLQTKYTESHHSALSLYLVLNICLRKLTYHLIVTVDREEVFSKVEEGQDAANSPNIYSLCEGQA